MSKIIETPQSAGNIGLARRDITPPVGMYHRMWGAARHDRSTAVHKPLLLTALWIGADRQESRGTNTSLILAMDHCILDVAEINNIRQAVFAATGIPPQAVEVCLSHTHGSGWMSRSRSDLPGGDLIGPYLDQLAQTCADAAREASANSQPAWIVYGTGQCDLACHRDYREEASGNHVCGYNPDGAADHTLLLGRIENSLGVCLGTVVNYACHPTTLAWENTSISPDYIGAFREIVERETNAPCIFLQGASGDLGPREGFVGDHSVADRNGKKLAFATLATLEGLSPARTHFVYDGPVISGAILGIWKHQPIATGETLAKQSWTSRDLDIPLAYRQDLPTIAETKQQLEHWRHEEEKHLTNSDHARARDCRALVEQMTRQLTRLSALSGGTTHSYRVKLFLWGDSLWIFAPGELYQVFQVKLRQRFPKHAVMVATIANDWQPGYLPEASTYGYGIYQEKIASLAAGSLELLLEAVTREFHDMIKSRL